MNKDSLVCQSKTSVVSHLTHLACLWFLVGVFLWGFPCSLQWRRTRLAKICSLGSQNCSGELWHIQPLHQHHVQGMVLSSCGTSGCRKPRLSPAHLQQTPKELSAGQEKDQLPQGCLNNTSPSWRALDLIKPSWCLRGERGCRITMQSEPHCRAAKPGTAQCWLSLNWGSVTWGQGEVTAGSKQSLEHHCLQIIVLLVIT